MPASQTRRTVFLAALALAATALLLAVLLRAAPIAHAAQSPQAAAKTEGSNGAERWLHVAVTCKDNDGERVHVNIPFSLARGVLASIQQGRLNHGIVHIDNAHMNDVDIRALLKAIKSAQDAEYVTVEGRDSTVRVQKQGGMLLIHVVDNSSKHHNHSASPSQQNVDVRVPLEVADALFSGAPDELNVSAALDLLARHGDMELVSVQDSENTVRIWMDTKTTQD
ncbi:MAG TPA: hypothetical protein VJW51_12930 [Candidatus Acidoferrales bacterium]|nr:hypothetical protein [Candidatus Acidoferrales bacterium]